MKKFILGILLIITCTKNFAQEVIQDAPNEGQLRRMVFQQWDDWQPDPTTDWLGIPNNFEGYIYWQWLHNAYYTGEDRRPYRSDGPFDQNYASLILQEQDDATIRDSIKNNMETNVATLANMTGGDLDVAWAVYFKDQFNDLLTEVPNRLITIAANYPAAFNGITSNEHYQEYLEYLTVTSDRLNSIHNALVDKGERMVDYLQIMKELRNKNEVIGAMIDRYVAMGQLPSQNQINEAAGTIPVFNNDHKIVTYILGHYQF
jgi:hypothetical protein